MVEAEQNAGFEALNWTEITVVIGCNGAALGSNAQKQFANV